MNRDRAVRSILMLAAQTSLAAPVAAGQGTSQLRGRVVDDAGAPIAGANITITSVGYSVRSDSSGTFVLAGTPGSTMSLMLRASGYREDTASVILARGRVVVRDFTLRSADFIPPEANPSDRVLRGRVHDESGQPLSYANVELNGGRRYLSDDSGRFQLPFLVTGPATVVVRRIGFQPAELTLGARPDTALRIVLTATPLQLKEVTVTATSAYRSLDIHGFYRRLRDAERGASYGWFVTPEDIERRKPYATTQMADGFPTVHVKRSGMGPMWDRIVGSRDCAMTVYLDNIRITGNGRAPDELVNQIVPVSHMAAMEIYPRAMDAPPEFRPLNDKCGVIVIWTK